MNIDDTLDDVRQLLEMSDKKCLLIYGDYGAEQPVKIKFNASLLDLNSMAAAAVMCFAAELARDYEYDADDAISIAIESIEEKCRMLSTKSTTPDDFNGPDSA